MKWGRWSFSVKQWSVLRGPERVSSRAVCGSNSSSAGPQGWWFLECKINTGFILKECVQFRSVCEEVLICAPTHFLLYSRSNFLELFLCLSAFNLVQFSWKLEKHWDRRADSWVWILKALWRLENLILNQSPWSSSVWRHELDRKWLCLTKQEGEN